MRKCAICEREIPVGEPHIVRQVPKCPALSGFDKWHAQFYCRNHYNPETTPELFDVPLTTTDKIEVTK